MGRLHHIRRIDPFLADRLEPILPRMEATDTGREILNRMEVLVGRNPEWLETFWNFPFEALFACSSCENLQKLLAAALKRGDVGGVRALSRAIVGGEKVEEVEKRLKDILEMFKLKSPSKSGAFKITRALLAHPHLGPHSKKFYYLGPALAVLDEDGREKLKNIIKGERPQHGRPVGSYTMEEWTVSTGDVLKELEALEKIYSCHSPLGTYGRTVVHSLVHGGGGRDHISIIVFRGPGNKLYRLSALGRQNKLIIVSDLQGKPRPYTLTEAKGLIARGNRSLFIPLLTGLSRSIKATIYLPGHGIKIKVNPPEHFSDTYLTKSRSGYYFVHAMPITPP